LPVSVNGGFDHRKDLGDMLHLIEGDRSVQAGDEAVGIALGGGQNARIIEGKILPVLGVCAQTPDFSGMSAKPVLARVGYFCPTPRKGLIGREGC